MSKFQTKSFKLYSANPHSKAVKKRRQNSNKKNTLFSEVHEEFLFPGRVLTDSPSSSDGVLLSESTSFVF